MATFPNIIVCEWCGASSRNAIQMPATYRNVALSGNRQSCSHCHRFTRIPDGVYSSTVATVDALASAENDPASIGLLIAALKQIVDSPTTDKSKLREIFAKAGIKQSEAVTDTVPKDVKKQKAWGALILTAIGYVIMNAPEAANNWIDLFEKLQKLVH